MRLIKISDLPDDKCFCVGDCFRVINNNPNIGWYDYLLSEYPADSNYMSAINITSKSIKLGYLLCLLVIDTENYCVSVTEVKRMIGSENVFYLLAD